jgi:hypothetical protein
LIPLALAVAALAGCGGGSSTVAHVGDDEITEQQLDALVDHFRTEAQREGKDFPEEGTAIFEAQRNKLLALLVYRTELGQAAERLGIEVTDEEISRRLPPAGGEEEGASTGDTFPRDSVRAAILTEKLFAKVTSGVPGSTEAERSTRRNARMAAFLARLQRETKVRYEPGYAPGP